MAHHAAGAVVHVDHVEVSRSDPADLRRLVVAGQNGVLGGDDEEPGVEVEVRRLGRWTDLVDVEIDGHGSHPQAAETGLLGRLPERDRRQVGVAVAVPAGLQPTLQLAVVQHDDRRSVVGDHERRAGEMTGKTRPEEGVVVFVDEIEDGVAVAFGIGIDVGSLDRPTSEAEVVGCGHPCVPRDEEGVCHGRNPTTVVSARWVPVAVPDTVVG